MESRSLDGCHRRFRTLAEVEPGRNRVVARAPGFAARVVGTTTAEGGPFLEIAATFEVESSAKGIRVDQDGKPISEVVLQPVGLIGRESRGYQTPEETTAITEASGRFEIRGLPSIRIQLRANKPGLHQEWDPREIAEVTLIFVAAVAGAAVAMRRQRT